MTHAAAQQAQLHRKHNPDAKRHGRYSHDMQSQNHVAKNSAHCCDRGLHQTSLLDTACKMQSQRARKFSSHDVLCVLGKAHHVALGMTSTGAMSSCHDSNHSEGWLSSTTLCSRNALQMPHAHTISVQCFKQSKHPVKMGHSAPS